jgi:hypothetical protein
MFAQQLVRNRPADSSGLPKLSFEGRASIPASGLTTIAAATSSAGHVFAMRWTNASSLCLLRYVNLQFTLTTAFGAAQAMGYDLIVARAYTASHTGGTAVDMGSTTANTGATRTNNGTSLFAANAVRVGGAGALTAGTQTLDANSYNSSYAWMGAVGAQLNATLLDARDDGAGYVVRSPITLAQNEGIVIRNLILMGATGVGTLAITLEWDEVSLQT